MAFLSVVKYIRRPKTTTKHQQGWTGQKVRLEKQPPPNQFPPCLPVCPRRAAACGGGASCFTLSLLYGTIPHEPSESAITSHDNQPNIQGPSELQARGSCQEARHGTHDHSHPCIDRCCSTLDSLASHLFHEPRARRPLSLGELGAKPHPPTQIALDRYSSRT